MLDFLVVGQGLAGTLLAHFLEKQGQGFLVIDQFDPSAASQVAAGIMNPVTGRRYVKSWKIDQLLPFAKQTYRELEQTYQCAILYERNILRALFNRREVHDWQARRFEPGYEPYLLPEADLGAYAHTTQLAFDYGEVALSAQVDLPVLLAAFREALLKTNRLLEETFDYQALVVDGQGVEYKGQRAKRLIFCEGFQARQNPFFNYLPFGGAKGEVLLVRIPDAAYEKLLKHRIFIVPLSNGLYWIGSVYENQFNNDLPTPSGRAFLIERLEEILTVPFEIVEHRAAIRPTVKDRRPFLGLHPTLPSLGIFNGLGTKGASLGPFFAAQMADFLCKGTPLDEKVDIQRWQTQ